jgi:hypothetical protein
MAHPACTIQAAMLEKNAGTDPGEQLSDMPAAKLGRLKGHFSIDAQKIGLAILLLGEKWLTVTAQKLGFLPLCF